MSIQLVIDMNFSPAWEAVLTDAGWKSVHWSSVGDSRASDAEIMAWARTNDHVVLTHDLDFGTMLALSHANGPSVMQIRVADVFPERAATIVLAALEQHQSDLESGALVVIDESRSRVRVLPIQ